MGFTEIQIRCSRIIYIWIHRADRVQVSSCPYYSVQCTVYRCMRVYEPVWGQYTLRPLYSSRIKMVGVRGSVGSVSVFSGDYAARIAVYRCIWTSDNHSGTLTPLWSHQHTSTCWWSPSAREGWRRWGDRRETLCERRRGRTENLLLRQLPSHRYSFKQPSASPTSRDELNIHQPAHRSCAARGHCHRRDHHDHRHGRASPAGVGWGAGSTGAAVRPMDAGHRGVGLVPGDWRVAGSVGWCCSITGWRGCRQAGSADAVAIMPASHKPR